MTIPTRTLSLALTFALSVVALQAFAAEGMATNTQTTNGISNASEPVAPSGATTDTDRAPVVAPIRTGTSVATTTKASHKMTKSTKKSHMAKKPAISDDSGKTESNEATPESTTK